MLRDQLFVGDVRVEDRRIGSQARDFLEEREPLLALEVVKDARAQNDVECADFLDAQGANVAGPELRVRDAEHIGPMLWPPEISATSDTYRKFLEQFIPQFKAFLDDENVLDKSLFHCADEPDGDVQMAQPIDGTLQ